MACAIELALDKPTAKYIDFAMSRVRMLQDFGIVPYLVFDGDALPSKAGTNNERRQRRDESKKLGLELYKAGKISQAHQELQKAASITPSMARQLIDALKQANVQYIVAPYEADAQLAYLEKKGIIDGILSEDSDLLVFGAKRLLTKLNQYGECVEIERADFPSCREISLAGWTDTMFRRMAILSGCDYLPNIEKMGLKTAYRYVRKYKDAEKVIRMVQFEGKMPVPPEYLENFKQAELTFIYHRVFCPVEQKMVFLSDLEPGVKGEDMLYLGPYVEPEIAIGVACGDLNARTKVPIEHPLAPARPGLRENRRQTLASASDLKCKKSIDSFFKPARQPLAELDPNSLTPSPSQQRLLERHRNASWEPRPVSSAPQLRRTATSGSTPTNAARHPSDAVDRSAFLARASTLSTYQPPKRQRLCSENEEISPSKEVKQSPFFASKLDEPSPLALKKTKGRKAKRSGFEVWSDDSIDDILLGLPDVQQTASPEIDRVSTANDVSDDKYDTPQATFQSIPASSPMAPSPSLSRESSTSESKVFSQVNISQITSATSVTAEDDHFTDLLDFHVRKLNQAKQRRDDMKSKTFINQSPERRATALHSIKSPSPEPAVPESPHPNTFAALSPERQSAALTTLSPVQDKPTPKKRDSLLETFSYQAVERQSSALRSLSPQNDAAKIEICGTALAKDGSTKALGQASFSSVLDALSTSESDGKTEDVSFGDSSTLSQSRTHTQSSVGLFSTHFFRGSEDELIPNSEDESSDAEIGAIRPAFDLKAFAFTA